MEVDVSEEWRKLPDGRSVQLPSVLMSTSRGAGNQKN